MVVSPGHQCVEGDLVEQRGDQVLVADGPGQPRASSWARTAPATSPASRATSPYGTSANATDQGSPLRRSASTASPIQAGELRVVGRPRHRQADQPVAQQPRVLPLAGAGHDRGRAGRRASSLRPRAMRIVPRAHWRSAAEPGASVAADGSRAVASAISAIVASSPRAHHHRASGVGQGRPPARPGRWPRPSARPPAGRSSRRRAGPATDAVSGPFRPSPAAALTVAQVPRQPLPGHLLLAALAQPLGGERADHLQHAEPRLALAGVGRGDQAVPDERRQHLQDVDVAVHRADRLGGVERRTPGADRQPGEQRPLGLVEQVVAPGDRGPQRPLPVGGTSASGPRRSSARSSRRSSDRRRQRAHPGGDQLDRQRQPLQAAHHLAASAEALSSVTANDGSACRARSTNSCDGGGAAATGFQAVRAAGGHGRAGPAARRARRAAAAGPRLVTSSWVPGHRASSRPSSGAAASTCSALSMTSSTRPSGQPVGHEVQHRPVALDGRPPPPPRSLAGTSSAVAQRRQVHPPDGVPLGHDELRPRPEGEPRLADAAGPGERHQPHGRVAAAAGSPARAPRGGPPAARPASAASPPPVPGAGTAPRRRTARSAGRRGRRPPARRAARGRRRASSTTPLSACMRLISSASRGSRPGAARLT